MNLTHISHNHYRISDTNAAKLARENGRSELPSLGRTFAVMLEDGRKGWLLRTPYAKDCHVDAPKRGWVWAVLLE